MALAARPSGKCCQQNNIVTCSTIVRKQQHQEATHMVCQHVRSNIVPIGAYRMIASVSSGMVCVGSEHAESPLCTPACSMCSMMPQMTTLPCSSHKASTSSSIALRYSNSKAAAVMHLAWHIHAAREHVVTSRGASCICLLIQFPLHMPCWLLHAATC